MVKSEGFDVCQKGRKVEFFSAFDASRGRCRMGKEKLGLESVLQQRNETLLRTLVIALVQPRTTGADLPGLLPPGMLPSIIMYKYSSSVSRVFAFEQNTTQD